MLPLHLGWCRASCFLSQWLQLDLVFFMLASVALLAFSVCPFFFLLGHFADLCPVFPQLKHFCFKTKLACPWLCPVWFPTPRCHCQCRCLLHCHCCDLWSVMPFFLLQDKACLSLTVPSEVSNPTLSLPVSLSSTLSLLWTLICNAFLMALHNSSAVALRFNSIQESPSVTSMICA